MALKKRRGLYYLLCLIMIIPLLVISVFAAEYTPFDNLYISDTLNNLSKSGSSYTSSFKGNLLSSKSNTITFTNSSDKTKRLTFAYTVSASGGHTFGDNTGTKEVVLTSESSVSYNITAASGRKSANVTISSIGFTDVSDSVNVTVNFDNSLGSVTVSGATVTSGMAVTGINPVEITSLVATAKNGASFVGWFDMSNNLVSQSATYNRQFAEDASLKAVFSTNAMFLVNDILYDSLTQAATVAQSGSVKTIILANNGTLTGSHTIPAGVTLLIPYDSANTLCTTDPTQEEDTYTDPSVFRTLTMADGANITVNGALSVSGAQSTKYGYNGMPSGPLGFIKMNSGSKITVNSGATLYAWGYIQGSGSVEIKSGGTVYECFQIADFRGGDATTQIVNKDDAYGVFPFNQYYMQNVEVPMTLHAGAIESGHSSAQVTLIGAQRLRVPFLGTEDAIFITQSGYVIKDYLEGTGRTSIEIYGDMECSPVDISMKLGLLGTVDIESSKYALPIPHHFTISLESGSITINQNTAFLPGSEIYIGEETTFRVESGKKVYFYNLNQWRYNNGANGYSGTTNLPYVNLKYVPGGNGTTGRLKDALVQVDGTLDSSVGEVYVTADGANIFSTGTGIVKVKSVSDTKTYQVTTNNTNVSGWPEITVTPARLKNADGSYTQTGKSTTTPNTFTYTNGKWVCAVHSDAEGTVNICDACGTALVAQTQSDKVKYASLAEAVNKCGNTDYIQMLTGTTETITANAGNDVYVDLNSQTVTLTGLSGTKKVYFMDKDTDGYEASAGRVITSVALPELTKDPTYGRYYVKIGDATNGYAFPRVAVSVTGIQVYKSEESYNAIFRGGYKGTAPAVLSAVGFKLDGTPVEDKLVTSEDLAKDEYYNANGVFEFFYGKDAVQSVSKVNATATVSGQTITSIDRDVAALLETFPKE